jgi:diadenosine tetraphosphatase ApaH/serine/threonine PP2A family protein phosphatase
MSTEPARHIIIGDIHGCLDELERLLRLVGTGGDDVIVSVGDLVAKGPDSQGVVALARERNVLSVRGNHDEAVLRHRRATLAKTELPRLKRSHRAVVESLEEPDWQYLEAMPLWLRLPAFSVLVVHAGMVPGVPLEQQRPEDLMTMRALKADGTASSKLDDGPRWASLWEGPERVIFGHDAISGLQIERFATGLDTGCVYGGSLTAVILPERRIVSVDAKRAYQELKE